MAADKLVDSAQLDGALTATADSIRAITGRTAVLSWDEDEGFKNELETISVKTGDNVTVSGPTVTTAAGYYRSDVSKTVASGSVTANTPTIVNSTGVVTGSATVTEGYVTDATLSKTLQLTTKAAATYNTSTSDQSIAENRWLTGAQTIKAVTTSGIAAGNIKTGVAIKVGDENSAGRIASVTGTFTDSSTVSSGQTAAAAGQMLSGYSAWVDGAEIKGSIETKTASNMSVSGATVTAQAGYYASNQSKSVASGSATTPATTISVAPSISIDSDGIITASNNGSKSVTPTVSAGYVSAGTAGTITVNGSNTKQMTVKAATTYNASGSDQSIASGTYLTGAQTIRKIVTGNISAGNIKTGVTITVGDSGSSTRIANVAGTFTASNTVSSGQTAAAAAQIRSGYSAWVAGAEVKGSIANGSITNNTSGGTSSGTINRGKQIKINAGFYSSALYYTAQANSGTKTISASGTTSVDGYVNASVAAGSATTPATTITVAPSISIDSNGKITASNSGSKSVTPTVSAGYVSSGTAGTITVNGSNTKQMTTKGATTFNISTSDQSIAASTYLTGAQTFRKIVTSNISAGNIKSGVTITVGDSGSSTRIANVTGTVVPSVKVTASRITNYGQISFGFTVKCRLTSNKQLYSNTGLTTKISYYDLPTTPTRVSYSSSNRLDYLPAGTNSFTTLWDCCMSESVFNASDTKFYIEIV